MCDNKAITITNQSFLKYFRTVEKIPILHFGFPRKDVEKKRTPLNSERNIFDLSCFPFGLHLRSQVE